MLDYLQTVQNLESGGDPNAIAPGGPNAARGLYQFQPTTFRDFAPPGANIMDPNAQASAMSAFTASNKKQLTDALGRDPTDSELYLAHQQGARGALKLLQNPDKTPAELGLGPAVANNKGDPNAPASAFVSKWGDKYAQASGNVPSGDPDAPDTTPTGTIPQEGRSAATAANVLANQSSPPDPTGSPIQQQGGSGDVGNQLIRTASALASINNPAQAAALKGLLPPDAVKYHQVQPLQDKGTDAAGKNRVIFNPNTGQTQYQPIPESSQDNTPTAPTVLGDTTKTGDEYLNSITDPATRARIQAVVEGRQPLPTGFSAKTPEGLQIINGVGLADPTFQAGDAQARTSMLKDLGKTSPQSIGGQKASLNTIAGHLDGLAQKAADLNNSDYTLYNKAANFGRDQTGDPRITAWNTQSHAVAAEVAKLFSGKAPAYAEMKTLMEGLSPDMGPQKLKAAITTMAGLVQERLNSLQSNYDTTMGAGAKLKMIDDKNAPILQKFLSPDYQLPGTHAATPSGPSSGPVTITGDDDYNRLPSGTRFIGPDGKPRIKP